MNAITKVFKRKPTLKQFVEKGLTANGGNYDQIAKRMNTINLFCSVAKEFDASCNFETLQQAYTDFFTDSDKIAEFEPSAEGIYTATYKRQMPCKKGDPNKLQQGGKYSFLFSHYREKVTKTGYYLSKPQGISIMQQEETGKPIIYLGYNKRGATFYKTDSYLYFLDNLNVVAFHWEDSLNYDEYCLGSDGTHAEFTFDQNNRLVKVEFANQGRLWWDKPKIINFENGYFLPKDDGKTTPQLTGGSEDSSESGLRK